MLDPAAHIPEFRALWEGWKTFPSEQHRLAILGDICEEHGCTDDARLYRWMLKNNKRPCHRLKYPDTQRKVPDKWSWAWYVADSLSYGTAPDYASLPRAVFVCLLEVEKWRTLSGELVYYASERLALYSLRHALARGVEVFSV